MNNQQSADPVTAETLTDSAIREFRGSLVNDDAFDRAAFAACNMALDGSDSERRLARIQVALVMSINARLAVTP